MEITLKPVAVSEVGVLQQLSITTYTDTFAKHNTAKDLADYLEDAYNIAQLTSEIKNPDTRFFFLYEAETLAGYLKVNVGIAQSEYFAPESFEVERIYILPAFKRKGYGKFLLNTAIDLAKKEGYPSIWLGVWEHNYPAQAFYQTLGFKVVGEHSFFMGEDEQRDLLLQKQLKDGNQS
ncbi:MAG: GNAT family N-acetyltransferase [Enterococcus sp.]